MTPKHARPEPGEEAEGVGSSPEPAPEPVPPADAGLQPAHPAAPTDPAPEAARSADAGSVPAPDRPAPDRPAHSDAVPPADALPAQAPAPALPAQAPADAPARNAAPARRGPRRGRRRPQPPTVRSRWMWIVLGVVGLGLLGWVLVAALGPDTPATPEPTASPTAVEQQTLLIQVRNDDDLGADNMVAGVGGGLPAAQLLVPSRLIVDVPGAGQQTLGQSARLLDRTASQDALSDLLALRIDGTLSLSRLALAGMVDFVGGITVTVDAPITQVDPTSGVETVVVPAGTQQLNGTQAAAYALAWLPEEPEANRLARYSAVMTETISKLPDDRLTVEQMLTSLGGSARTTTTTTAVADFLLRMRAGILAGGQLVRVLPTTDIEAGTGLAVVRVDLVAAEGTIEGLLPQAMLDASEAAPRVLVQNGVGTPGLGASARDKLVGAGMVYINGGNAEQFGQPTTTVIVADATTASLQLGSEVATALGVPESAVTIAEEGQNVADAVVVLGADFTP